MRITSMVQLDENVSINDITNWMGDKAEILIKDGEEAFTFSVGLTSKWGYEVAEPGDYIVKDENGYYVLHVDSVRVMFSIVFNGGK